MKLRNAILASVAAFGLSAGAASAQQAAPGAVVATPVLKQGDAVLDPQGGSVGTVASVSGDTAVVDTGANKVALPVASFAKSDKGLMISATKAQLDELAIAAANELKAQIRVGANITDTTGAAVGSIIEVGEDFAIVETAAKNKVRLPIDSFARGNSGPMIGATAAQLDKAATEAAAQQTAADAGS